MEKPSQLANHLCSATSGDLAEMLDALRVERIEISKDGRGSPRVTIFAQRKRYTGPTLAAAAAEMTSMGKAESAVAQRLGIDEGEPD